MPTNMGAADRLLRIVLALAVAVLYFTGALSGTAALVLGILAVGFLLTGAVGTCPLYLPFGISTRGTPPA